MLLTIVDSLVIGVLRISNQPSITKISTSHNFKQVKALALQEETKESLSKTTKKIQMQQIEKDKSIQK